MTTTQSGNYFGVWKFVLVILGMFKVESTRTVEVSTVEEVFIEWDGVLAIAVALFACTVNNHYPVHLLRMETRPSDATRICHGGASLGLRSAARGQSGGNTKVSTLLLSKAGRVNWEQQRDVYVKRPKMQCSTCSEKCHSVAHRR